MTHCSTEYVLPSGAKAEVFLTELEDQVVLSQPETSQENRFFVDTFDRRIQRLGGSLWWQRQKDGVRLFWRSAPGQRPSSWPLQDCPTFASALPKGSLRTALEPVIQMRRLLPLVEVRLKASVFRVLDRRQKTVAYLHWVQSQAVLPRDTAGRGKRRWDLTDRFAIEEIRGYSKKFQRLTRLLGAAGLRPAETTQLEAALAAAGCSQGSKSSKLQLELSARQPAEEALQQIFLHLLSVLEVNEAGVRSDLDSEFLHEFRVAVRRTRAALTQVRGVFPATVVERFRQEFSWLGKVSGPTRDLDVYLLKMPTYEEHLPPSIRADLEPLRHHLRGRQRREQKRLTRALASPRYRSIKKDWRQELESKRPSGESPPNALMPISKVAAKRIWKAYKKVFTRGSAIHRDTPAEALHDLRIDCKKLRYLLEFFRSLFAPQPIASLIRDLKKLQDTLGDFNDFEVQRDQLSQYADEMTSEGSAPASTLLAMGRLLALLEEWQHRERLGFHPRFEAFSKSRPVAQKLFRGENRS
ncbi:MAG: CHAD domain-containing protein [Deltaproteobacteria bacterium]|nr:CHAD domain-containing protein [Deltaproteobacteria bacterium]